MAARDSIANINPLVLDDLDRKHRITSAPYRMNNAYQIARANEMGGISSTDKEIAVFCLNNWKLISSLIRAVN